MEYNAASVKILLWHVETKETAKLLQEHSFDEIRRMVLEDNIYQQKSRERAQSEFSCIKKRLQALPEELIQKLIQSDIQTKNFDYPEKPLKYKHIRRISD